VVQNLKRPDLDLERALGIYFVTNALQDFGSNLSLIEKMQKKSPQPRALQSSAT
jgi:hypothetical protein